MRKIRSKMSALLALAILGGLPVVLDSCTSGSTEIDYIPVKESKSDKWGLMSPDGEFLFMDEFESCPTIVREGIFSVQEGENGLWTVYKAEKKPQALKDCEGLKDVGMMHDGLMPIVRKGERITIIDNTGKTKFDIKPVKDQEVICAGPGYNDGMLQIQTENGKWGFIDKSGNVKIKPEYDRVNPFVNGYAIVGVSKDSTSYDLVCYVIDKKGEKVYKFKEDSEVENFSDKYIVVRQGDRLKILDYKGKEIAKCPAKVSRITDMNDKHYVYVSDGNYGVMDFEGEVVIRAKYDHIQILPNGTFACIKDDKKGCEILDKKGEVIKSLDVEGIFFIPGFGIMAGDEHDLYMVNEKGEKIGKKSFYDFNLNEPYGVYSDYFDAAGAATAMAKLFTGDTFTGEGVKLGASAPNVKLLSSKNISELSGYTNDYYWDLAETRNYEIKGWVSFSAYYKLNDYGYDSNFNWYDRYYLNPGATVELIAAQMQIKKSDFAAEVGKGVVNAFKGAGAKETYSKNSGSLLTKGEILYGVIWSNSENEVAVFECRNNSSYIDNLKKMINELDEDNSKDLSKTVRDEMETVAVEEDSVAVEVPEAAW